MLGILTTKRSWDTNKHSEIIDIFITLIVMIVSRVWTYAHAHQITYIKHVKVFVNVNYTSKSVKKQYEL